MKQNIFTLLIFLCGLGTLSLSAQTFYTYSSSKHDGAFLGIQSDQISDDKAEILGFDNPYGSYVTKVLAGTAAEKAGIQPFDYIYGIDDQRADDDNGVTELIHNYDIGDNATIHLIRKGKPTQIAVTFGDADDCDTGYSSKKEKPFLGINRHSDNEDDELGVRIYTVRNSTAEAMGLQKGDLITAINGYPMVDWDDISAAIANAEVGKDIVVEFEREGRKEKASAPIKSYAETKQTGTHTYTSGHDYAFLGIYSDKVSKTKAKTLGFDNLYGHYVSGVITNTAAEKAGIQPFDYIYGVDEYRTGESQSLGSILKKYKPQDKVTVHLIRKGSAKKMPVTLGSKADAVYDKKSSCEEPFFGIRQSHKAPGEDGVRVTIVKNSTAEAMGMADADQVTTINGYKMLDWTDIGIAIDNMKVGNPIKVEWLRDGKTMKGEEPIKSQCDTKGYDHDFEFMEGLNLDFNFNNDDEDLAETRDISNMKVEMKDVTENEASNMRRNFGIDMPVVNNLQISQLNLFPNPSAGMFNLKFDLPQEGETTIRIFNSAGRLIYNYELGTYSGSFEDSVDISQNGAGTYYLEIRQDNKTLTKKIILQKR